MIARVSSMDRSERQLWASQLRRRRDELGFTREYVAAESGVSVRQIAAAENGEAVPQEGKLRAIMRVIRLGVENPDRNSDPDIESHVSVFRSVLERIPAARRARFMGLVVELAINLTDGPDPAVADRSI